MTPRSLSPAWVGRVTLLLTVGLLGVGCTKDERAARCSEDRVAFQALLSMDQRVSGMLREVDDLALTGRPIDAADRIDKGTRAAMDEVVTDANQVTPRTKWGVERKKEVVGLTQQRRELLDAYAKALRSEDLQRVVAEMEKQRDLEKRAVEVQRGIASTPEVSSGACDPP